jgi:tetratricopeptide (TPR) repeat protein
VTAAPALVDVLPLLNQGCYRCFVEAFEVATRQQQPGLAFEAALLAALRSKELGMPPEPWMARAREAAGAAPVVADLIDMVEAVSPEPFSGDREVTAANPQERLRVRKQLPAWRARLAAGQESAGFRRYLEKALVCELEGGLQREAFRKELGTGLSPLLEFGASTCGYVDDGRLRPMVDAGFVDGEYAIGRWLVEGPKDHEQALRRFRAAAEAFPSSLSIRTQIGNVHLEWEEWQPAADAFDAVLAVKPRHPDALLGRTQALSRLGRYQDGVETATRLIEGGTWFLGPAHYWRAWNHHALKNFATARADMARTKQLMVNGNVFLLSGLIEWGLEDRSSAEIEFQESLKMDLGQCESAFYLGGVRAELRNADPAIAAFKQAIQCYDLNEVVRRKLIEEITAGTASEGTKARQIAAHQRAIDHNTQRKGQAIKLIGQLQAYIEAQSRLKAAPAPAVPTAPVPPPTPVPTPARPRPR